MTKVCHISTLHARNDVRIFQKELCSLSATHDCYFIVADGLGDEEIESVKIVDIGLRSSSRLKRSRIDSARAFDKAIELNASIYHLHDPELMNIGLQLKGKGKIVFYDAHEDLPQQILTKDYIPKVLRRLISIYYKYKLERFSRQIDAIVAATPIIKEKFQSTAKCTVDVCNFPIVSDQIPRKEVKRKNLVYIGGISEGRGIISMLDVIQNIDCELNLAGKFFDAEIERQAKAHPAWNKVNWLGYLKTDEINNLLEESAIGLVLLKGFQSYRDSLPVKMFEYMNAGIPFIASDFRLWKEIAESNNCGICIHPDNVLEIAKTLNSLLSDPNQLQEMGMNGKKAINEKYNWNLERKKLLTIYSKFS